MSSDVAEVEKVLQVYFDGLYEGDTAKLGQAFHPASHLYSVGADGKAADFPRTEITLLDHALWIHRALPWDDWWLVKTESGIGVAGRCLSRREIFARDGRLVASAAWEAALHTAP